MSLAEGFVINVVCDFCPNPRDPRRDEFGGKNARDAYSQARRSGWRIYRAQWKARCPSCVKKLA